MATDPTPAPPPAASESRSESASESHAVVPPERRPYSPPQLRHLGSVRDLTLGIRGGANELPGLMGKMKT